MDRASLIFCGVSLAGCLLLAAALFPFTALSKQQLEATRTAQSAEQFEDVDLGDFGVVPVLDLVSHYIENPPEQTAGETKKVRFQGC